MFDINDVQSHNLFVKSYHMTSEDFEYSA